LTFTTELKIPPDRSFESLVESFASDAARRSELTHEQQHSVAAAARRGFATIVDEALLEAREPIHVVASSTARHLELSLFERGLPVDDALAKRNPRWNEFVSHVDSVHWRSHGTAGSELRLVFNRPHAIARHDQAPQPGAQDVPIAPEQEYTVRRFERTDAPGVARAFYLTYGYAYDMPAVYTPERLIELNQSERYVSIVAVTADGQVVGHYALAREGNEPIADACGAVVLPAHRGRNLLNRLRDRAEAEAVALGLAGYFSEPVTDHPRTQHASESFGAKACGITLGVAPRSFVARHMELSTTAQRQSCMLYVKVLRTREPRTLFAPPRHREIIASIYEQLRLPVVMSDGERGVGEGCFESAIARSDGTGTIAIRTIGTATAARALQAAEDLRATRRLGAIYALLPLEDPGTPELCEAMESSGLFFSGVGPWMLDGHDALRLQLPLAPIDLSVLVIIGAFGKVLLEYIGSEQRRCSVSAPSDCVPS
jgi:hypothetical protein